MLKQLILSGVASLILSLNVDCVLTLEPQNGMIDQHRNLFYSLMRNSTEKSEIYSEILQQEVAKEQQNFRGLKQELWIAQKKSLCKKRNIHKNIKIDEKIRVTKRETNENDDTYDRLQTSVRPMRADNKPFPIDLTDFGYFGSWNAFCNDEENSKTYSEFPQHDLIRMKVAMCLLKDSGKELTSTDYIVFATYKYCLVMRSEFDDLLRRFTAKLSLYDQHKKAFLLDPDNQPNKTECYVETLNAFHKTCAGEANPCTKMFKLLLARGCEANWLTKKDILSDINEICAGKWITDDIDWETIFQSIKYVT